jgi:hypothetical protein
MHNFITHFQSVLVWFLFLSVQLLNGCSNSSEQSSGENTNWVEVNTGLTDTNVHAFAVSGTNLFAGYALAVSGTNLFAGTNGKGVWRLPL